jgi:capsular polysaccharide biosynthesis protein
MPFAELLGALRRHWILLFLGVLLTGGLSVGSYMVTKPVYEITATVLLLPPASAVTAAGNPYLQLGGLRQTVDLVGVALSDQNTKTELEAISKDVEYTVAADSQTSSPILVVDVTDSSPEGATRIRDLLVARIPQRLQTMQEGLNVLSANRVTTTVLTSDDEAKEVGRNRLRAAVVVGLGGLALTLAFISLWDARRPRKAAPRKARSPLTTEEPRRAEEPGVSAGGSERVEPGESGEIEELADTVGLADAEEFAGGDGAGDPGGPDDPDEGGQSDETEGFGATEGFDQDAEFDEDTEFELGELDEPEKDRPDDAHTSLALVAGGEPEDVEV